MLENKRFALALHYCGARPEGEEWAIGLVTAVRECRRQGMALEVLHGKKVAEVRPIGLNKGNALRTLLVGLPGLFPSTLVTIRLMRMPFSCSTGMVSRFSLLPIRD